MGRCGLSSKELSRVEVMGRVKAGSLRLQEAAELPGLSYRQAKRVWARYRGGGAKAAVLVRLSPTLKATLSEIAKREHRSQSASRIFSRTLRSSSESGGKSKRGERLTRRSKLPECRRCREEEKPVRIGMNCMGRCLILNLFFLAICALTHASKRKPAAQMVASRRG